ncbi:MAG: MBL fold metallo-hydrolase [Nitrososphaerota archaeon]|nr:MBL fold metallo-hydrolase [Nitrososphaerota archaeon]
MGSQRRSFRKNELCIEALVVPPLGNNVFILYEDGANSGTVIDVGQGSKQILQRLKELELKLDLIINTHGHTDHTAEDDLVRNSTSAKLAIHELDAYRLATEDEASRELRIEKRPIEPDLQLVDGQIIQIGKSVQVKVLHTPGHTEGSICLYDERRNQLFSGDTLFAGGYGRTDGAGADPIAMVSSLKKLLQLPRDTEVYPGHGPFTTIGNETWIGGMIGEN